MMNIVDNYAADTEVVRDDEGVVAIEYVVVAAAIVAALAALWSAFGTTLATALDNVVNSI